MPIHTGQERDALEEFAAQTLEAESRVLGTLPLLSFTLKP